MFCNLNRKDFRDGLTYEPKDIRITCNDSFQTLIMRLNELKLKTKDWKPKYSFSKYKRMTLLELAEEVEKGTKTKEFDIEDLRADLTHFLTEEYGNFGILMVNDGGAGILRAVGICSMAKSSGTIHHKDLKKLCNWTLKETIKGLLE